MKNSMMKSMFFTFLALSLLLIMAGCSDSSKTASKGEEQVEKSAEVKEEDQDSGTRIISTEMGDIEVPVNPERVVVNWYVGDLAGVGIKPVAISGWLQETMPFYEEFKDVPLIEKWEAEEIMTFAPDLIITYDSADFEKLSKVAPVLVISEGTVNSLERQIIIGEATGRGEEAKKIVATFEDNLKDAKKELQADVFKDKTFSIFEDWGSGSYGVYYETGSRGGTLLYEFLEVNKTEKLEQLVKDSGEGRGSLSYEVAADYFGDYILWFLQEDYESEFAQTEIWDSIPAVKEGRIVSIPGEYSGLFYYSDATSLNAQLDYMVESLLKLTK